MKYSVSLILILLIIGIGAVPLFAQLKSQGGIGLGVVGGVIHGNTDYREIKDYDLEQVAFHVRGFLRYPISGPIYGELGGGFGRILEKGIFQTRLIPIENRFLFSPISTDLFSPYFYGGIGILNYKTEKFPSTAAADAMNEGWTGFVPMGVGFQVKLLGSSALEVNGGYNYAMTDKLDALSSGSKDGYWSLMAGLSFASPSGEADPDNDGLTNNEEDQLGTDPKNPDTDGDGLSDGAEFAQYLTNPLEKDSDFDGLDDREEIMQYETDPTKKDTDEDGLSDSEELKEYKTDPLKPDTDGDGLTDGAELQKYNTSPLMADTDGDNLDDGEEIKTIRTDPTKADTDEDGLSDGQEVLTYKTDPLKKDTDEGTVNDGDEVKRGTNPLNKDDDVEKKKGLILGAGIGVPIVVQGVFFELNSAKITPQSEEILDKVYKTLSENPEIEIEINGHTDNTGSAAYNMKLSKERAASVKNYLVRKGINPGRITTEGYGETQPIATNSTSEGRQKNRRIEFVRVK